MHSTIAIEIQAPADDVFALVERVEHWPEFLPHYRWVRRKGVAGGSRILEMAAWRGWYPVRWTSRVSAEPATRRLRFTHVAGPTRGMEVEWQIDAGECGARAAIVHDYRSSLPLAGRLYEWVVGHLFIDAVAGRTLRRVKQVAEIPYGRRTPRTGRE